MSLEEVFRKRKFNECIDESLSEIFLSMELGKLTFIRQFGVEPAAEQVFLIPLTFTMSDLEVFVNKINKNCVNLLSEISKKKNSQSRDEINIFV